MILASMDVVFGTKNEGERSCTVARAEEEEDVIPRLSSRGIFIAGVGRRWVF
jgi:hypothetical protein